MRLRVKQHVNMSGGYAEPGVYWETEVIDHDTGLAVGSVRSETHPATRYVSLFDGKYRDDFATPEECDAFIKGVEAVLNHMTSFNLPLAEEQAA